MDEIVRLRPDRDIMVVCGLYDMLWALGGFEEETPRKIKSSFTKGYSLDCWREIVRIAAKSTGSRGEITNLAIRFGCDRVGLRTTISQVRRGHRKPPQAFIRELGLA